MPAAGVRGQLGHPPGRSKVSPCRNPAQAAWEPAPARSAQIGGGRVRREEAAPLLITCQVARCPRSREATAWRGSRAAATAGGAGDPIPQRVKRATYAS